MLHHASYQVSDMQGSKIACSTTYKLGKFRKQIQDSFLVEVCKLAILAFFCNVQVANFAS